MIPIVHNKLLFFIFLITYSWGVRAQQQTQGTLQDSLKQLGHTMYNEPNEALRLAANYTFIKTLVHLLKSPDSFDLPFDSLHAIAIKTSPDKQFRIFSWHLKLDDGSYRYYGAIQLRTTNGELLLKPLVDKSPLITKPAEAITDNSKWYGAQYYDIVPLKGLAHHYLLLGWRGNTPEITEKVIEVLQVNGHEITFGKPLFNGRDVAVQTARMIYRYHAQASMLLKYDKQHNRLLMDHLAPAQPALVGQFKYYGPDMSYDAWKITKDGLQLVEDLPLKNEY